MQTPPMVGSPTSFNPPLLPSAALQELYSEDFNTEELMKQIAADCHLLQDGPGFELDRAVENLLGVDQSLASTATALESMTNTHLESAGTQCTRSCRGRLQCSTIAPPLKKSLRSPSEPTKLKQKCKVLLQTRKAHPRKPPKIRPPAPRQANGRFQTTSTWIPTTQSSSSQAPAESMSDAPVNNTPAATSIVPLIPDTQNNSESYSPPSTTLMFPSAVQIVSDIINQIQSASTYTSHLESVIRRNTLLSYQPYLISQVETMLTLTPNRTYKVLDDIQVACIHYLGF